MDWWMVTGGVGLFFFVGGPLFVFSGRRFRREREPDGWWPVQGTVVDWKWIRIGDGAAQPFPIVEYPVPDGGTHRFRSRTTAETHFVRTGVPIAVLVNPSDPTAAQLATSARTMRRIGRIHMIVGGFIACLGLAVLAGTIAVLWLIPQTR